jgi:myo-inositol-1(or 4)-monophosphatase
LSEEVGELKQESSYKWIIDPIDGTINFAHGIPLNCISIAIEHQQEITMAAVYNPHLNEMFLQKKARALHLTINPFL